MNDERRAALCIGVGKHRDSKFGALPGAVETTRAIAKALQKTLFGSAALVVDPRTPSDVFDAIDKATRSARGGSLLLYFAGFVTDRNGDLLLVVGDADAAQRTGCVPWSDVEDILRRSGVARTLLILNAERSVGEAPLSAFKLSSLIVAGAVRPYDSTCGDAELVAYADALTAALSAKATSIAGALEEGILDARGLDRVLARDPMIGHKRLRDGDVTITLRDLRAELPKPAPPPEPPTPEPEPEPAPAPAPAPAPEPASEPAPSASPAPAPAPALALAPEPALAPAPRRSPIALLLIALLLIAVVLVLLRR